MKPSDLAFKTILEIDDTMPDKWVIIFTDGSSVSLETVHVSWAGLYGIELREA